MKNVGIPLCLSSPDKRHVNPIEDADRPVRNCSHCTSTITVRDKHDKRSRDTIAQVPPVPHTAPADSSRLSAGRCARLWLSTRNISFFLSHESNARADFRLLLACLALDGEKHEKNNNAAELSRAICKFDWLVITAGVTKASHERKILEKQEKVIAQRRAHSSAPLSETG